MLPKDHVQRNQIITKLFYLDVTKILVAMKLRSDVLVHVITIFITCKITKYFKLI